MHKTISAILLAVLLLVPSAVYAEDDKSAVLVVSFGTSVPEARHAIDNLADSARKEFPKCEVRLAFTSNIIRRKIARESGESIPNPVQALAQLNNEGFSRVYVMPTHMIPGEEFDELANVVGAFGTLKGKYGFRTLKLGRPFLDGSDDCEGMADVLLQRFRKYLQDEHTAVILMGHGTPEHFANAMYSQLQLALDTKAYGRFFVGTVEAAPKIEDVIVRLKRHPEVKKLILSPMMIVAGDHAHNDLAGEDDPESWVNVLKAEGWKDVSTYLVGLGEDENIARKFTAKISELME
ncbi:MAG: sirohydrochlorin cobaltochelatase [Synergistaceae bacterium]|nr:sirohydrochlorin cobaltochelatase [Synergistaceae bacterium]